jgi:hypothetical protein
MFRRQLKNYVTAHLKDRPIWRLIFITGHCKYLLSLNCFAFCNVSTTSDIGAALTSKAFVYPWEEELLCCQTGPWFVGREHTLLFLSLPLKQKASYHVLTSCTIRRVHIWEISKLVWLMHWSRVLYLPLVSNWINLASLQYISNSLIKIGIYSCTLCVRERGKCDKVWTNFDTRWTVANLGQAYKACLLPEACYVVFCCWWYEHNYYSHSYTLPCAHRAGKRMKMKSVSESTFNIRAVRCEFCVPCALDVGPFQGREPPSRQTESY